MKTAKWILGICAVAVMAFPTYSQPQQIDADTYKVEVDLVNIENDRVKIRVYPPRIEGDSAIYQMPKIVPGTYSISDFGRFVSDFTAVDKKGKEMEVARLDTNRWAVVPAKDLEYVSYWVDDTFDEPQSGVFAPGGTQIEAGECVIFNAFGFVGYFRDAKNNPFELHVERPEDFYGATTLPRGESVNGTDVFLAADYFELHDCPILYARPDTASAMVGDTEILVAVYSQNGRITADQVMEVIGDLFPATAEYLGGTLPTDKYGVLVYFSSNPALMAGMGALEHHTSTVVIMPEWPMEGIAQYLIDITAHEFLHIVTPLNIHSEHVADFDFIHPSMSRHLWLFEGVTEYTAHHVQVTQGLITVEDFLATIKEKLQTASLYREDVSFTEMSQGVLGPYEDQFLNVYMKGALVGMALDLRLLHLSEGAYGLKDLMKDLMERYGTDRPFEDSKLFDIITEVSGMPEIKAFLENYIAEPNPLPIEEVLGYAGVTYHDVKTDTVVSTGYANIGFNPRSEKMVVVSTNQMDDFGRALGFERKDAIMEWNGAEVTAENFHEVMQGFRATVQPGDRVEVKVLRENENGESDTVTLSAEAMPTTVTQENVLSLDPNPSPMQLKIRKAWLGN